MLMKLYTIKIKIKLFYINKIKPHKKIIFTIGIILIGLGIVGYNIFNNINNQPHFFYTDYEGNIGVANWCGTTETGLICDRTYGGRTIVQQYWRGE